MREITPPNAPSFRTRGTAWAEDTLAHQDGNNFGRAVAMEAGGMGEVIHAAQS